MAAVTLADVQALLDQSQGTGFMVSCYADTSVAEGFQTHWLGQIKTAAGEIRQMLANDHQARLRFEQDLEIIRRTLEGAAARQAKGMAVFSREQRGFLRAFPLDLTVDSRLVIHENPYLVPLLQTVYRQEGHLLAQLETHPGTDIHRTWLYTLAPVGVNRLGEVEESVPKLGYHRGDHLLHHLKRVALLLDRAWGEHLYQGIVMLGEPTAREHLLPLLPARLAAHLAHEASCPWTGEVTEPDGRLRTLLAEVVQTQERRLLEQLGNRVAERRAVATGPAEVIDALQTGKLGPQGHGSLLMGPDAMESVARCTACRWLSVDAPTHCSRCQAACVLGNLWEELLSFALRHQLLVHFFSAASPLAAYGGVAALLARTGNSSPDQAI